MTGNAERRESGEREASGPVAPGVRSRVPAKGNGAEKKGGVDRLGGRGRGPAAKRVTGSGGAGPLRFYNFPCPVCGSLARPLAVQGGVRCSLCGEDITRAVLGMARVTRMSGVGGGVLGFAACGRCGSLVIARRELDEDEGEHWLCTRCGRFVFV